jgi:hypothetical protein
MQKTKKLLLCVSILFSLLILLLSNSSVKAAGTTTFGIRQELGDKVVNVLSKKQQVDFEVFYSSNTQNLAVLSFEVSYDSTIFEYVSISVVEDSTFTIPSLTSIQPEIIDNTGLIRVNGYSLEGISTEKGSLFVLTLKAIKSNKATNVGLAVIETGIINGFVPSSGLYQIGLASVSFTSNSIPWWVYLIIVFALILSIAGGYVFHLFLPNAIKDAAKITQKYAKVAGKFAADRSKQIADRTKELANRVLRRGPVAPKMKKSETSSTTLDTKAQSTGKVEAIKVEATPVETKVVTPIQTAPVESVVTPTTVVEPTPVEEVKPTPVKKTAAPKVVPDSESSDAPVTVKPKPVAKPKTTPNVTKTTTTITNPDGTKTRITKTVPVEKSEDK